MQNHRGSLNTSYLSYAGTIWLMGGKPSETFFCNCHPGGGQPICTSSATTYQLQPSSQLGTPVPKQHNMVILSVQSYRDVVHVQAKIKLHPSIPATRQHYHSSPQQNIKLAWSLCSLTWPSVDFCHDNTTTENSDVCTTLRLNTQTISIHLYGLKTIRA